MFDSTYVQLQGGPHGGFRLATRERPIRWGIESTSYHGPNLVRCKIVTGITQIPLVRAYLQPLTLEQLTDLEEALQIFRDPIFLRDLNMDLGIERISRSQCMLDLFAEYILIDLVQHFQHRHRF